MYKPADIIRVSELSGVVEGGEARLTCDAEGYPQPKIYWTREEKGHFITLRDRHSAKSREGDILVYLFIICNKLGLHIGKASLEGTCKYYCNIAVAQYHCKGY